MRFQNANTRHHRHHAHNICNSDCAGISRYVVEARRDYLAHGPRLVASEIISGFILLVALITSVSLTFQEEDDIVDS
jgi:hypothetical protein